MKNFIVSLIAIIITAALLQMFLPWCSAAVAAFAVGFFVQQKSGVAFLAGFIAVFLLWVGYAYFLSAANEHILAGKVAELMKQLTGGKLSGLLLLTGVIGGLVSGFAALTGRLAANLR